MFVRTQFSLFRFENLRLFTICLHLGRQTQTPKIVFNFFFFPTTTAVHCNVNSLNWALTMAIPFWRFFFTVCFLSVRLWTYLINQQLI